MKNSYDIVLEAVIDFWTKNTPCDVVIFFYQKYEFEKEWCFVQEYVTFNNGEVEFTDDFCEGQTCVKYLVLVPFNKVAEYYYNNEIKKRLANG